MLSTEHHVVIIGGGFGGINAAHGLRRAPVRVTLLDRRNFHLFQPLLYQVATGGLSPSNIASPLRWVLRRQKNATVLLGAAAGFDPANRRVLLADGELRYDTLVVAAGAGHHYFGHDEWEPLAPGLKTLEDATEIRRRILTAFEAAERQTDPAERDAWLTFVVVGGGPTGVELAGTLGELSHYTLKSEYRNIDPSMARILLIEGADRVLTTFPPKLSAKAEKSLNKLGVTVRNNATVTDIRPAGVTLRLQEGTEDVKAYTVLWTAGVRASPLGLKLSQATGAKTDRAGRILVEPDLTVPGHPEIFVVGDLASFSHQGGKPLPGVAPVAMQQGRYVAKLVRKRLAGQTLPPFHYRDKGNLATIGRASAVADLYWIRLSGFLGWLVWLFIHLMYIVAFANRVLVFFQWAWNYFTLNRTSQLITGEMPVLFREEKKPADEAARPEPAAVER